MIERVKLTKQEVIGTDAYKKATSVQKKIYAMPHYVNAVAGWLTVGKIKGKEAMMNIYHLDDFKKKLLIELSHKID